MSWIGKMLNKSNPFSKDFWLWSAGREIGNWIFGDKSFTDAFNDYTGIGGADGILNSIGKGWNDLSGQTESDIARDKIADENATVAHERQKELMALEAEYNSPVYKANELGKAGLNPVLASGVSNSVSGASAQMSQPNAGQGNTSNMVGMLLNIAKTRQDIEESGSRIKANEAAAEASKAKAEYDKSAKALTDKEVEKFDEKFNLEKGLKEAQTAQLKQAEKNMKNWLTNGSITSLAELIKVIGITVGAVNGFRSPQTSELLIPEVVEPLDKAGKVTTPDFDDVPKRLSSGNVKGTRSYRYDAKNKKGIYTMDDGSEFEYGVDENGFPWSKTKPNPYNGNVADAENLMHEWMDRIRPVFGE